MISDKDTRWLLAVMLCLPTVNLQIQMPITPFMPPPMHSMMLPPTFFAPPPPPPPPPPPLPPTPIAFQLVQIQEPGIHPAREKTENNEKTIGIAIPLSFPAPMQFNIPAFVPPPSYSSPYQSPLPYIAPEPALLYQYQKKLKHYRSLPSTARRYMASGTAKSSGLAWNNRHKKKRSDLGFRKPNYRKIFDYDTSNKLIAEPVLSYISDDGDIKLEKRLSDDEAAELMEEERRNQRVEVKAEEDAQHRQSVKIVTSIDSKEAFKEPLPITSDNQHQNREIFLTSGSLQRMLGTGKKELIFKPPHDKKISNLSVSFQIT